MKYDVLAMTGQEILANRGHKKGQRHLQGSRVDKHGTPSHLLQKTSNPMNNDEILHRCGFSKQFCYGN